DDGSTDGSYEQLNGYRDPRLKVIKQENQGVSIARNIGVANASADYVAFLDADDCYHSDFLERISKLIKIQPQAALYCCRFMLVDEQGKNFIPSGTLERGYVGELPCFFSAYLHNRSLISSSSMAVRKAAFLDVGGFPAGKAVGEDMQLILNLALKGSTIADYSIAATVFRNTQNRTAQRHPTEPSCHIEYFLKTTDWKKSAPGKATAVDKFIFHNTLLHIGGAMLNNQPVLARYYVRLLWKRSWTFGALASLISVLPPSFLRYLKYRRNHG
ncbi:MAG: glycosyltransferase family 2 protein, partial [Alishewanella aestuarii]